MTLKKMQKLAQESVDKFNNKFKVGTKGKVKKDDRSLVDTETKTEAYVMSCTAVIFLDGIRGCYSLDRFTPN